jgi:hypothetical protein
MVILTFLAISKLINPLKEVKAVSKMKCEDLLSFITEKWEAFQKAEYHSFNEFIDENGKPRRGVLKHAGVYVIYEGDKPIYVGSAGKGKRDLRCRIKDLFKDYRGKKGERKYYHTLTRKLLTKYKRFKSLKEVQTFYFNDCRLKILEIETLRKSRLMEAVLINLLEPKPRYNDEIEVEMRTKG